MEKKEVNILRGTANFPLHKKKVEIQSNLICITLRLDNSGFESIELDKTLTFTFTFGLGWEIIRLHKIPALFLSAMNRYTFFKKTKETK